LIDTWMAQRPEDVASLSIEPERQAENVVLNHYEVFTQPGGLYVYVAKGGELVPVDTVDGERLLWQVTNSQID
jgi:hypothetical protein